MTVFIQNFSYQSWERRIQVAILAALSILCVSCSTPPVPNSYPDEGTSYWAYQQCMAQSGNQTSCNRIGVTNGSSYTDWTYGTNLYVNDYQPTGSVFSGKFYKTARQVSYRQYVESLPQATQDALKAEWLRLAGIASE